MQRGDVLCRPLPQVSHDPTGSGVKREDGAPGMMPLGNSVAAPATVGEFASNL